MQIAAKNNLFLTDVSSKQLLETKNSGRLYQQILLYLTGNFSHHHSAHTLARRLVSTAELAYAHRQMVAVSDLGSLLSALPLAPESESIGRYYTSLSLLAQNDWAQARVILESVVQEAPPAYRARAMLSIGGSFIRAGDLSSALKCYVEAPALSSHGQARHPLISYIAQHNAAAVRGMSGDHRGALAELESLFPVARMLAPFHPKQYYGYLNSLAIELGEAGRLNEAQNICKITLASSFAHAYPEWRETADEILLKAPRRSSTIALPGQISTQYTSNVFHIGVDRNTSTNFQESPCQLPEQQARVLSFTSWKTQMSREPLAKPKPRVSVGQMTRKQKIIRIVDLVCNEISDEQLDSILQAVERIAPDEKVKD